MTDKNLIKLIWWSTHLYIDARIWY